MATIVKRNQSYAVVYYYKDENGEEKQKWETVKTYKEAIRNGQIETNPCELQNLPKIPEHRINYLDLEGRKKFLAQINQLEPSDYRYIVGMLAYYTGMRASEIAALQWSDINFAVNRIYVTKAASTILRCFPTASTCST